MCPAVVFEVAYSHSLREVSGAAARIIGSSFSAVRLLVAINVQYDTPAPDAVRAWLPVYFITSRNRLAESYVMTIR